MINDQKLMPMDNKGQPGIQKPMPMDNKGQAGIQKPDMDKSGQQPDQHKPINIDDSDEMLPNRPLEPNNIVNRPDIDVNKPIIDELIPNCTAIAQDVMD